MTQVLVVPYTTCLSILNEFSHDSVINPTVRTMSESSKKHDEPMENLFWRPDRAIYNIGIDNAFRGTMNQPLKQCTDKNIYARTFTEKLFEERFRPTHGDLMAIDINRGRDVGLRPYNEWRKFCRLPVLRSWNDLRGISILNSSQLQKLKTLYKSIDRLDLMVGGLR